MDFLYDAVNAQGDRVSGRVSAKGEREAVRQLRGQELTPLEIRPAVGATSAARRRSRAASEQDKTIVVRELATLLSAGVSLAEAVESIGQSHTDSAIGEAFRHVYDRLRSGESFSQGVRDAGLTWPPFFYQLVAAGEETGKLAEALRSAADQMEYDRRISSEMRNALIYPAVLVFSGIAATLLIFIVVVPKFANILKNSRAQVPEISIWVLNAGVFVQQNVVWVLLGVAALVLGIASWFSSAERRTRALQLLARVPLVGEWLQETEVGRWAAMLSTLLANRVPILRAMELTEQGLRLPQLRARLGQAMRDVRSGKKLAEALSGAGVLNVTGLNLVRVGERSGELPGMLRTLALLHETAARDRLKRFLILLEPAAILVIGIVIGFIMVSVMLAITSMTNLPV